MELFVEPFLVASQLFEATRTGVPEFLDSAHIGRQVRKQLDTLLSRDRKGACLLFCLELRGRGCRGRLGQAFLTRFALQQALLMGVARSGTVGGKLLRQGVAQMAMAVGSPASTNRPKFQLIVW